MVRVKIEVNEIKQNPDKEMLFFLICTNKIWRIGKQLRAGVFLIAFYYLPVGVSLKRCLFKAHWKVPY
jgi:hypothetical protein